MIKNATVLVTNQCNSRCTMCNIWQHGITGEEMSLADYENLFIRPEFGEIEDLNISGGEPLLREDINEIVMAMVKNMPKVHMFFLSTSGTRPQQAKELFELLTPRIRDIYLCVSLEGDRDVNYQVRGIDSYNSALKTINLCKKTIPGLHSIISMTLTKRNCNLESLKSIKKAAEETDSTYTFRMAWLNDSYYHNIQNNDISISEKQRKLVIGFMKQNCLNDPFMRAQVEYFETGQIKLMEKCYAGDVFILVKPDGTIYPCINSSRKIGDKHRGIFTKKIKNLGKYEQCPCCTECCYYPMLNWSSYHEKN